MNSTPKNMCELRDDISTFLYCREKQGMHQCANTNASSKHYTLRIYVMFVPICTIFAILSYYHDILDALYPSNVSDAQADIQVGICCIMYM